MAWNQERAQKRIAEFQKTVPEIAFGNDLSGFFRMLTQDRQMVAKDGIFRAPRGRAVVVEGAHVYGELLDFSDIITNGGRETPASHERVLQYLHMHYKVWDGIVDGDGAHRVDYHGPRLHAIVTEPAGNSAEQLRKAIALCVKLQQAARRVSEAHGFPSRIRFGIDHGHCLALNTGRAHERDTLFLGSPANHAAKLAAEGDEEGVFLTENAQRRLGLQSFTRTMDGRMQLRADVAKAAADTYQFTNIEKAAETVASAYVKPSFVFFRPTPPLSDLKFAELYPSHSARLGSGSLFADIHAFGPFVDNAIKGGEATIRHGVAAIHVLREELNAVLQQDFSGKRVRFIGDCIHGLIAKGNGTDDPHGAVLDAALCASGMRSSFSLCQATLGGIDELDLAVGIEYGPVPITRIGDQGVDSVRCAAGCAVIVSERIQQAIEEGGIRFGDEARNVAKDVVKYVQDNHRVMDYATAADLIGGAAVSPIHIAVRENPAVRPYSDGI